MYLKISGKYKRTKNEPRKCMYFSLALPTLYALLGLHIDPAYEGCDFLRNFGGLTPYYMAPHLISLYFSFALLIEVHISGLFSRRC